MVPSSRVRPSGELARGIAKELRGLSELEWFLGAGTLALVCVWVSFGSPAFFMATFAESFGGDPWVDWYQYLYYHANAFILLALIPFAVMRFRFGIPARELGLTLGDWRFGLRFVAVALLVATPALYFTGLDAAFQAEYPLTKLAGRSGTTWFYWQLTYLLYFLGWEPYFRGVLLFGLREKIGVAGALFFQTAISTLVHIGKPPGELLVAIPAGFLFGAVALRTGSFLWPLIVHHYVASMTDVFCYMHQVP